MNDTMTTFYRAWRDAWDDDRIGARTSQRVTGMTPEEASGVWGEWVLGVK